ncbi:hypothetical protein RJ641_012539, partial [Dillenia turbinata]
TATAAKPLSNLPHQLSVLEDSEILHQYPQEQKREQSLLFVIGFFLDAIPWYIGVFLPLFTRVYYQEKLRFIAFTVAVSHRFLYFLCTN